MGVLLFSLIAEFKGSQYDQQTASNKWTSNWGAVPLVKIDITRPLAATDLRAERMQQRDVRSRHAARDGKAQMLTCELLVEAGQELDSSG
jgi:hypothetical protein